MITKNLLVELFVEELPPKSLKKLGESFAETLASSLQAQGFLEGAHPTFTALTSPRRLSVLLQNVLAHTSDQAVEMKLMPASVGLDAGGNTTPALLKKATALGITLDAEALGVALIKRMDGKAETLFIKTTVAGSMLGDGLQKALLETLSKLPISKIMSYQLADGWSNVNFVRPAHSLIALHGADIVPINVLGLKAGRITQGHRFEANSSTLEIREADSYESQMENDGAVIASFAKRRAEIARQLATVAAKEGLHPIQDEALLDEVTGLVERPNVLLGTFEKEFLDVPQECLILTMKANQKYFPLLDNTGKLTNKFLIVSNITPADPSAIIQGNERVVRARLADAKFFFDKDRKYNLSALTRDLERVVYHNKLGVANDMLSRTSRVAEGARVIGNWLGDSILSEQAYIAASLSKADLLTDMVGEFPELQGIMGCYYAQAEREYYAKLSGISPKKSYYEKYFSAEIPLAIEDHYKPRFAGDALPRNTVGICAALADKFETLVGMFGIGEKPTGDKDPHALRRQALGVIRILTECNIPLPLDTLIENARTMLKDDGLTRRAAKASMDKAWNRASQDVKVNKLGITTSTPDFVVNWLEDLQQFIFDRFSGLLREQGYTPQEVDAVLSQNPQLLADVPKRLAAVRVFAILPEAASLAAANKRVGNILKKSEVKINGTVDLSLLKEPAEILLHQTLSAISPKADAAFEQQDYTASLQLLAALKSPVDDFFDSVMVNVDDVNLRNNRLALLLQLQQTMNRVADISKLAA